MFNLKKKQSTDEYVTHTEVYHDGKLLGYYLRDSLNSVRKWGFSPKVDYIKFFNAKNEDEILETLKKQINKEPVTLYQFFGIVEHLN